MKKKLFMLLALAVMTLTASAEAGFSLTVGTNEHGTIKFKVGSNNNANYAQEGETVTVTITPATGWAVKEPSGQWIAAVAAARSQAPIDLLNEVELTPAGQNKWTFTMKRANVEISATYKKLLTNTDITTFDITPVTYNGRAQKPRVTLKDGTTTLVMNTDYTVEYSNNIDAGTATVTITGMGENYAGTITKTFTIKPAELTSVTLMQTELTYNIYDPQPQTVLVKEVKAGSLVVPAAQYDVDGNTETELGTYTVTVTGKKNFTGTATAQFSIVKKAEEVQVTNTDNGQNVDGVEMDVDVIDPQAKTLIIKGITIPQAAAGKPLTVYIPGEINGFKVAELAAGLLGSKTNVTDVYLPDTEEPIAIGENALPATANIHTTLPLLDDYALMATMQANFESLKISATATPKNRLWTFSSGVDCVLPEGVTPYIVYTDASMQPRIVVIEEDNLQLAEGRRGILANNGVLLSCDNGEGGNSFEIVASPGNQQSGTTPSTANAKSFDNNQLEPVIEPKNHEADNYLVLKDNKFHTIMANSSMVSASKAVLRIK